VMPIDVYDEASESMTVDVNAESEGVLNVDHDDIRVSKHLVEPVSNIPHNDVLPTFSTVDDPSELQGVESPPEFHVVDMNDKNILDDSTIDNEVDPEVNGVSATTAVTYITRNNIKDMDNRYGPHSCRYHLRIE